MAWIPVRFYGPARDVIHAWPLEVKKELGSVLTRLQKGESIGMPDVRPMPDVSPRASEKGTLCHLDGIRNLAFSRVQEEETQNSGKGEKDRTTAA